jgi:hypothetical protein
MLSFPELNSFREYHAWTGTAASGSVSAMRRASSVRERMPSLR